MTRRRLTEEEIDRAVEMRERGMSPAAIARLLKCSPGAVAWHCLRLGADPPGARPIDPTVRGPVSVVRNGFAVRRFLPAEDAELQAMAREGLGDSEIARRLGRRHNSIRGRLMTLARREERLAAAGGRN